MVRVGAPKTQGVTRQATMTDKQRADHVQAKYWNGYITRTEIQKVFEETAGVIQAQQQTLQKMDMVISCIAEKVGLTAQDVNEWVAKKVVEVAAKNGDGQATPEVQAEALSQEPSRIVLTD